jgi:DNA-binding GntR family transcriptional regulator
MIRIDATPGGSWSFVSNETETEFMMAVTGGSKPSIHRIERQSLPETLAASLRERILNGEFKEGDPLVQETIAEEYEVSRMPVREALRQLEALGLIVMRTHKGAIVTSMQQAKVAELFDLRAVSRMRNPLAGAAFFQSRLCQAIRGHSASVRERLSSARCGDMGRAQLAVS